LLATANWATGSATRLRPAAGQLTTGPCPRDGRRIRSPSTSRRSRRRPEAATWGQSSGIGFSPWCERSNGRFGRVANDPTRTLIDFRYALTATTFSDVANPPRDYPVQAATYDAFAPRDQTRSDCIRCSPASGVVLSAFLFRNRVMTGTNSCLVDCCSPPGGFQP